MKNLNSNNYFVKTSHILFHNCNIMMKYKLTNYNNNISFEIFENCHKVGDMIFKCTVQKTSNSIVIDEIAGMFGKLGF